MPLILPNDVANLQPADGDKLQQNFVAIESYVNQEVVRRDGSVGMTGPLLLPGPPTQSNQAATKAYVDAAGPVGSVIMFAGDTEPSGYLFCRGQAVSRSTYAVLFTVIGTRFGTGDGSTTFNLPNYQGTVPVGHNTKTNPPTGTVDQFSQGIGERAGRYDTIVASHRHVAGSHAHGLNNHQHDININSGDQSQNHYHNAGSGGELMQTTGAPGYYLDTFPLADVGVGHGSTGWATNGHIHNVVGWSGFPNFPTTAFGGNVNTDFAGQDGANQNLQPSLSINFLIKVS